VNCLTYKSVEDQSHGLFRYNIFKQVFYSLCCKIYQDKGNAVLHIACEEMQVYDWLACGKTFKMAIQYPLFCSV
jgi:hypothetical protein